MFVIKRDGTKQNISFDKVLFRIKNLCADKPQIQNVNCEEVAKKIISCIYDGVLTSELDIIAADICQPLIMDHLDYGELASRLLISNHHKNTLQHLSNHTNQVVEEPQLLVETYKALWNNKDINNKHAPIIAPHILKFIVKHADTLNSFIDYKRDYNISYSGFNLMYGSYLLQCSLKTDGTYERNLRQDGQYDLVRHTIERPQHMWLRVALGIWLKYPTVPYRDQHEQFKTAAKQLDRYNNTYESDSEDESAEQAPAASDFWDYIYETIDVDNLDIDLKTIFERVKITYDLLSQKYFMHATPTLFHSGTITPQLSSCFLTTIARDDLNDIGDYVKNVMMISKWAGGVGSHIHHIRPEGSYISGTGGTSNGIVPLLRTMNEVAKYVDQGGSKRPGSHAIYLEPWHGDIISFIELKKPRGNPEQRARSLFYAIWIPDEFMRTIEKEEEIIRENKMRNDDSEDNTPKLWYLMDPNHCPGLADCYDEVLNLGWLTDAELALSPADFAFTTLYRKYINENKYIKQVSATEIWKIICDLTQESGTPYKLFKDACNRKSNQKNLGTIKSSNLCVAPETRVLTRYGYMEIRVLSDEQTDVWNGSDWSEVTVKQTNANAKLIQIKFSNYMSLECTEYHKFHIKDLMDPTVIQIVEAKDLKHGMILVDHKLPRDRDDLEDYAEDIAWLEGIIDGAGKVDVANNVLKIRINNLKLLQNVYMVLQLLGVWSSVEKEDDKYTIYIDGANARSIGLFMRTVSLRELRDAPSDRVRYFVYVTDVVDNGRMDATYCFTEPIRHMGMFNGVIAGNCTEIVEYSDANETAVCNLASICVNSFVTETKPASADVHPFAEGFKFEDEPIRWFDFEKLQQVVKVATLNLNRIINQNYYPIEETRRSNMQHRPIGIGIQGLADCFSKLYVGFDSELALKLDFYIHEHLEYASMYASMEIAKVDGVYATFSKGYITNNGHRISSPAANGKMQYDLWNDEHARSDRHTVISDYKPVYYELSCDWHELRISIQKYGLRNSLTTALMPTASTSSLTSFSPAFEPHNAMIYKRPNKFGEHYVCNVELMTMLYKRGLWTNSIKNQVFKSRTGSIQDIVSIPKAIRDIFKGAYDMSPKIIINHALARSPFVNQSQSMNLFIENPSHQIITQTQFYGWKRGIKTGCYYLRELASADARKIQVTTDTKPVRNDLTTEKTKDENDEVCTMQDGCVTCSS